MTFMCEKAVFEIPWFKTSLILGHLTLRTETKIWSRYSLHSTTLSQCPLNQTPVFQVYVMQHHDPFWFLYEIMISRWNTHGPLPPPNVHFHPFLKHWQSYFPPLVFPRVMHSWADFPLLPHLPGQNLKLQNDEIVSTISSGFPITSGAPTHGRASFFFRNYWLKYIEFCI